MSKPLLNPLDFPPDEKAPRCRVVVRVTTSFWHDNNGMSVKRTLRFMKRQCVDHNFLLEDAHMIGAEDTIKRITNLDECEDGLYDVVTCNESVDYWTGTIDDWDFMLVPLK